jgi:hypothetical protein
MVKESHEILAKDNRHYKEEIENIKNEIELQRQVWKKEIDDTKQMVEQLLQ